MASTRLAVVGFYVICGVALAVTTLVLFGRFDLLGRSRHAEIVFDGSISGLAIGSPVTFRGVRVGRVSSISIEFDPKTHKAFIPVKIVLHPRTIGLPKGAARATLAIAPLVAQGLRAQLLPVSLVSGDSEIDLDFDSSVPAVLHPGLAELPEIPVSGSSSGQVVQRLSELPLKELVTSATLTTRSVRELSDMLAHELPPVLESTRQTSGKAGQTLDAARTAIVELQARSNLTLDGLDRLTATANRQVKGRGADLHTLLVSSNQTIHHTDKVVANLGSLTDESSPARANLESTLNDLSDASAALRGAANDIEQNPRLLLSGRQR